MTLPSSLDAATARPSALARAARSVVAAGALVLLAACSGGTDASDMGAANATLVRNDPYPNVAADPARGATAPRSSAEVRRIEDRMMSLAAEQGSASRSGGQSTSVVDQMKALAKRNQSIAAGTEPPPADEAQPTN